MGSKAEKAMDLIAVQPHNIFALREQEKQSPWTLPCDLTGNENEGFRKELSSWKLERDSFLCFVILLKYGITSPQWMEPESLEPSSIIAPIKVSTELKSSDKQDFG